MSVNEDLQRFVRDGLAGGSSRAELGRSSPRQAGIGLRWVAPWRASRIWTFPYRCPVRSQVSRLATPFSTCYCSRPCTSVPSVLVD